MSFPDGGNKVQISNAGGINPKWTKNGREVLYLGYDRRVMAVPIDSLDPPTPGAAALLLDAQLDDFSYDVTADGQRFAVARPAATKSLPISVDLDWRQRLPPEAR